MSFLKRKKIIFINLLLVIFICLIGLTLKEVYLTTNNVVILTDSEYEFVYAKSVTAKVDSNSKEFINVYKKENSYGNELPFNKEYIKSTKEGNTNITFSLFGIFPIKELKLNFVKDHKLLVVGKSIGVKMNINGVLVVGMSDVSDVKGEKMTPAKDAGIQVGDIINKINNIKINSILELFDILDKSKGETLNTEIVHNSELIAKKLTPAKSNNDMKYHIGIFGKDVLIGLGTMTFYDPEKEYFGALGHGIWDTKIGNSILLSSGELYESKILAIRKGIKGKPGELCGIFENEESPIGEIKKNCSSGIFGTLNEGIADKLNAKDYSIGYKSSVIEGSASIISNIDGTTNMEYKIEIKKIIKKPFGGAEGIIISVIDKRLLEKSGGIVQGMSGSPIIQDNKIIGAVTHVMVNDPTRGYGIFIEDMMNDAVH